MTRPSVRSLALGHAPLTRWTWLGGAIGVLLAALVIATFLLFLSEERTHPRPCQIFEVCE